MKVAQIVPSLEARHGGPSRSVRGLAEGLSRLGENIELLTTGKGVADSRSPEDAAPVVHTFLRQRPEVLARSESLHRHLLSREFDIVHNHGLWLRPLHYANKAARKSGIPLIISPRGMMSPWAWGHRRWKKRLAAWFVHPGAFQAARGWHATAEAEARDIRNLGFRQPICVAPNGVTPPVPTEETTARLAWLELLPELAGRRVALFYSRFHSKKRVLELIDLWLSKPRADWLLLVAGIPEEYSVNQLKSHIVRNGGGDRVLVRDGQGLPPPYAVASLFLLPSHSENFGLVIAEALVRGVPVLTTDTTPWRQLAEHGAGRCVPWEDYATELDALLTNSECALAASGDRARTWATATFSWETTASILSDFYRHIAAD